jgi:hypothetical protein
MNDLIKISVGLGLIATLSGNLPKIIYEVRKAQFKLVQESKASKWPKAIQIK